MEDLYNVLFVFFSFEGQKSTVQFVVASHIGDETEKEDVKNYILYTWKKIFRIFLCIFKLLFVNNVVWKNDVVEVA